MFISTDIKLYLYHSTINKYQVKTKNTEKTLNKLKKPFQYNPIQKQVVKSSIQHQIIDGLCQFRTNNTILRNLMNPGMEKNWSGTTGRRSLELYGHCFSC